MSEGSRTAASDEELVAAFQAERRQYAVDELLRRHEGLVVSVARNYFVPGGDDQDVRQQAMIGFWKAARDYTPGAGAAFTSFARTCMQRQVITAVKAANRHKHAPLTESQRLAAHDTDDRDDDGGPAPAVVPSAGHEDVAVWRLDSGAAGALPFALADIENLLEQHGSDAVHEVLRHYFEGRKRRTSDDPADQLTESEAHVLVGLLSGKRYQEIAEDLGRSAKFVDNAVQRLRTKLRHLLEA